MNKKRLSEAEFTELKRKRDDDIAASLSVVAELMNCEIKELIGHHQLHNATCYCGCPDGPCQHVWNGPEYKEGNMVSRTCSRCVEVAFYHDIRVAP